jgi:hypothetical protein
VRYFIFLTPLFIYFPRFLPNVETQPLLPLLVAMIGLIFGSNRRSTIAVIVMVLTLVFWIIIKALVEGFSAWSIELILLLIGPILLFGALGLNATPPPRSAMAVVSIYFVLLATFEIFLSNTYGDIASSLLIRSSILDGHRGISLFTPEPTYATLSVVYFLVVSYWSGKFWGFRFRWIEPMLVICLLATGSTYMVLVLLVMAYVRWPQVMMFVSILLLIALSLISFIALENEDSFRAVVAISRLLAADMSNLIESISVLDNSLGSRLIIIIASFQTPFNYPLGLGLGCEAMPNAFELAGYHFVFGNEVLNNVIQDGCLKPSSYFSALMLGLGAFSLVFIFLIIYFIAYNCKSSCSQFWLLPMALAFLILFIQGQITNPIPWLLLFLSIRGFFNRQQLKNQ